jgi:hypothetical protein
VASDRVVLADLVHAHCASVVVVMALADAPVVRRINVLKGRPPEQVGSVVTTPLRIPLLSEWAALPEGLTARAVRGVMDALCWVRSASVVRRPHFGDDQQCGLDRRSCSRAGGGPRHRLPATSQGSGGADVGQDGRRGSTPTGPAPQTCADTGDKARTANTSASAVGKGLRRSRPSRSPAPPVARSPQQTGGSDGVSSTAAQPCLESSCRCGAECSHRAHPPHQRRARATGQHRTSRSRVTRFGPSDPRGTAGGRPGVNSLRRCPSSDQVSAPSSVQVWSGQVGQRVSLRPWLAAAPQARLSVPPVRAGRPAWKQGREAVRDVSLPGGTAPGLPPWRLPALGIVR